jgi:N-acetyl-gamma-glutamyl-phosphate reductase
MSKIKVGIIGASGYTGLELFRILKKHPLADIVIITSETHAGKYFSDVHPHLKGFSDLKLEPLENIVNHNLDVVFLALPHGVSMDFVKKYGYHNFKVIDLSGDLRLKNVDVYKKWYKQEHACPEVLNDAVFGLPELFYDKIKNARLISNPGCYPTSAILPLAPLLANNLIDLSNIIIDSKSGVSGAGAKAKDNTHFPNVNDNFSAYGLINHRHTPEIEQALSEIAGKQITVQFSPHLLPISRGILSTIYTIPKSPISSSDVLSIFTDFYKNKPFVIVSTQLPSVKDVKGTNYCKISPVLDTRTNHIIIVSVIDNLVKGASGQAVQNMNIMFGLNETLGLIDFPLAP